MPLYSAKYMERTCGRPGNASTREPAPSVCWRNLWVGLHLYFQVTEWTITYDLNALTTTERSSKIARWSTKTGAGITWILRSIVMAAPSLASTFGRSTATDGTTSRVSGSTASSASTVPRATAALCKRPRRKNISLKREDRWQVALLWSWCSGCRHFPPWTLRI